MSVPYIGEIRILPYFRGAPSGWQICDGSILQISQYETLYQLLGTTYGGDGNTTFGVPDLRGRLPVHQGAGRGLTPHSLGETGGTESVTLMTAQMATHAHTMLASTSTTNSATPANAVLAAIPAGTSPTLYALTATGPVPFPSMTLQPAGGNQPHDNTAPTLTLNYCISTEGLWPAQP